MKIISFLLVVLVCISLSGCRKSGEDMSSFVSTEPASTKIETVSSETASSAESAVSSENPVSSVKSAVSSAPVHTECSHTFSVSTVNATCTEDGVKTQICTKCFIEVRNVIKATGHTMSGERCSVCGYADVTECRNKVCNWLQSDYGGKHTLSDSRYIINASGGGNIFFNFADEDCHIEISVYGWEKNTCYIRYIINNALYITEGEFPMDSVHSSNRIYFNQMNSTADGTAKEQEIAALRGKIDGVLLKFQEVMQNNTGISLKDMGFTAY